MISSKRSPQDINKNKIKVKSGSCEYFQDILDLVVFDTETGKEYPLSELFTLILKQETEIELLKNNIKELRRVADNVDQLLTTSVDLLSKKVARLEVKLKEITEE